MVAAERTVVALLAAGRSMRFGGSKLDEMLWGKPLGLHAAAELAELPFLARIAVTGAAQVDYAACGFDVIRNPDPQRGQSTSLRLAARYARDAGADALLIALADMPCITEGQVRRLLQSADGESAVVASADGEFAKPPALFGRAHFPTLLALEGDRGARDLIRPACLVPAPAAELIDVDTRADLARLAATRGEARRSG